MQFWQSISGQPVENATFAGRAEHLFLTRDEKKRMMEHYAETILRTMD
jgi:hypothetical protein